MWSQYYQSTISELLQNSLVRLCMEHVPYEDKLEIDGIVCISSGGCKQIVVKMHEIVDRAYRDMWNVSLRQALQQESRSSSASPVPLKPKAIHKSNVPTLESNPAKKCRYEETPEIGPNCTSIGDVMNPLKDEIPDLVSDSQVASPSNPSSPAQDLSQDSFDDATYGNFSECSPVTSMLAYRKRPQRQRVPLAEELATPSFELACKQCPEKFMEFEPLEKHNREVHGRCTCRQCYSTFSLHCNLRRHERLHTGHKPFNCRVCQSSFSRNGDLRVHVGKHRGPQTCQSCSSVFQSAGELQNHECAAEAVEGDTTVEVKKENIIDFKEKNNITSTSGNSDANSVGMHQESADSSMMEQESSCLVEVLDEEETDHQMEWDRETDPQNPANHVIQAAVKQESKLAALLTSDVETGQSSTPQPSELNANNPNKKQPKVEPMDMSKSETSGDHNTSMDMASLLLTLSNAINSSPLSGINSSPISHAVNDASLPAIVHDSADNLSLPGTPVPATPKSSKKSKTVKKKIQSIPRTPSGTQLNNDSTPREHFCRDCGIKWPDFEVYETHCVERHIRFPCKYCEQTFSNKNNRGRHERTHTGHKQHSCRDCGKCFTRSDTLKEHRITHTEVYFGNQCFCGAVIEKKSDLLSHVKKCLQKKKQSEKLTANLITPEDFRARLEAKSAVKSEPFNSNEQSGKTLPKVSVSSSGTQNFVINQVGGLSQIQQIPEKGGISLLKPLDLVKKEIDKRMVQKKSESNENVVDEAVSGTRHHQSTKLEKESLVTIQPLDLVKRDLSPDFEKDVVKLEPCADNNSDIASLDGDNNSRPPSPIVVSTANSIGKVRIISSLLKKPVEENANEISINSNLFADHGNIMEENGNVLENNDNLKKTGITEAASAENQTSGEIESSTTVA